MAIAFRSVGTRLKTDVTFSGSPQSVGMPAGHVVNDWLLLVVLSDDNTGPSTPSGWTHLGTSVAAPATAASAYPRMTLFHRIDTGALGASVSVPFSTAGYPTGDPYVLAFIAAYSGVNTTGAVDVWAQSSTVSTTAAQAHPQLTTVNPNDWLLTVRGVSAFGAATFTISGGSNTERVDDTDGFGELSVSLYDNNAALVAGVQTQRTTTADRTCDKGSVMFSVAIKPSAVAGSAFASAGVAEAVATAFNAETLADSGPWDLCAVGGTPAYTAAIDWNGDGDFTDPDEDVTDDVISDISISYGRDQDRQLSPAAIGNSSFNVVNADRKYSPEYTSSPLHGELDPARAMQIDVAYAGTTYPLFRGRIDDYDVHTDFGDRTANFSFLDGLSLLQGIKLSTGVYQSYRTGDVINTILDLIGWTGPRDVDSGATVVAFWWVENTDALAAVQEIVKSEGPPAIAYVAPDGTFIFRDRHHRLLRTESQTVQGTFTAQAVDCDAPPVSGLSFTPSFTYSHGWRDIINTVSFDVQERAPDKAITAVWTSEDTISLSIGQSVEIEMSGSDPFIDAITPVEGTDFIRTGVGAVSVQLNRTSGQAVKIVLIAIGGSADISNLRLRARTVPVRRTVKVSQSDAGSITRHGERAYPDQAPWANAHDALAIANMILLHYGMRRPTVQLRIVAQDPVHYIQILLRTVSDRIHITNAEMGLDADFFVERVTHLFRRVNRAGHPPVHSIILGCEKELEAVANPFTFDKRGAGFDEGVFDPLRTDNASTVFIFDHPTQGQFNLGLFGT